MFSRRRILTFAAALLVGAAAWAFLRPQIQVYSLQKGADRLALQRQFDQAFEQQAAALALAPESPAVIFRTAVAARRAKQYQAAATYLQRAERAGWPLEQIRAQHLLLGLVVGQRSDFAEVEQTLRVDSAGVALEETFEYLAQGAAARHELAVAAYYLDQWATIAADRYLPSLRAAQLFVQINRPQEALDRYQSALRARHGDRTAMLELAAFLARLRRYQESQVLYQQLLDANPQDSEALYGRALAQYHVANTPREFAQAEASLLTVATLSLEHVHQAEIAQALGKIAENRGDDAAALTHYQRGIAHDPHSFELHFALAQAAKRLGQSDLAATTLARAKELRTLDQQRFVLERAFAQSDRSAADRAETAIQLAELYLQLGRASDAENVLHAILILDPAHARAHELLADLAAAQGDERRAAHHRGFAGTRDDPSPKN